MVQDLISIIEITFILFKILCETLILINMSFWIAVFIFYGKMQTHDMIIDDEIIDDDEA